MGKRWYELLLPIAFAAMVVLCVALNVLSPQGVDPANIAVNAGMFVIVAIIFLSCGIGCFMPMSRIVDDLNHAAQRIRDDAMNAHEYLWEPYRTGDVELFQEKTLKDIYRDYVYELNRISEADEAYYKCDIEDYISLDIVDRVMHRNSLNQVAGALTGLGILGTFIGLSMGLQSFNTGSTAEVTGSITPLMNGIKVAFHTSIFGMVFSLVFNYVYKKKLYEAEVAVEDFVDVYKKYVLPDTAAEGSNRLMDIQKRQLEAIEAMTKSMTEKLAEVTEPQFRELNHTVQSFGEYATRSQAEAMGQVVDHFIAEMDCSMQNTFRNLANTINEAEATQANSAQLLGHMKAYQSTMKKDVDALTEQAANTRAAFETEQQYLRDMMLTRKDMNESFELIKDELRQEAQLLNDMGKLVQKMSNYISDSNSNIEEVCDRAADAVERLEDAVDKLPQSRIRRQ